MITRNGELRRATSSAAAGPASRKPSDRAAKLKLAASQCNKWFFVYISGMSETPVASHGNISSYAYQERVKHLSRKFSC
jgi:hypothetical protein